MKEQSIPENNSNEGWSWRKTLSDLALKQENVRKKPVLCFEDVQICPCEKQLNSSDLPLYLDLKIKLRSSEWSVNSLWQGYGSPPGHAAKLSQRGTP